MKKQTKKKPDEQERNTDGLSFRSASIEVRAAQEEGKSPSVRMSISSEEPVLTYGYLNEQYQRFYEVLDHSPEAVDMSRCADGLVIQDTHWGDQIGLMQVENKDRKLGGVVEFGCGDRSQEIGTDAAKGIRKNTSVGYAVKSEDYRIEGDIDGIPLARATRWMPYEASFVPVPADKTVGVGRSAIIEHPAKAEPKQERTMNAKEIAALFARAAEYGLDMAKVRAIAEADEMTAERAGSQVSDLVIAKQAEDNKKARTELESVKEMKPEMPKANVREIGAGEEVEKEVKKRYSLMTAVRALAGQNVDVTFEREVSDELAKQRGKPASGLIIPHSALAQRDFTVSGTSSASVETDLRDQDFIDLLRSKVPIQELGITTMSGLVGNIAIPKQTAAGTAYWVAESTAVTESQPTLGQVTGTPHTVGALTDISRRMMIQSTPDAENMVRDDITRVLAIAIFSAIFAGTGADGQPSAITNASGMNNPTISSAGTPTYAEILAFIEAIYTDNAEGQSMKWLMTPEVWAKMCETMRTVTYGDVPILDPTVAMMLGYDWIKNTAVPANSLWFGDWSTVVIGIWGNGLDMIADTSTLSNQGALRLVGLQDVDIMVRNGEKIAYNTAVTA